MGGGAGAGQDDFLGVMSFHQEVRGIWLSVYDVSAVIDECWVYYYIRGCEMVII